MMYGLFEALKKDRKQGCNCLIIAENDLKAKELYEDYRLYNRDVYFYPARDLIFFQADIHGNLLTRERMQVIAPCWKEKYHCDYQYERLYGLSPSPGCAGAAHPVF